MTWTAARVYTAFAGTLLLLQGASTLAARLYPPFDQAVPALLLHTRMVPVHSLLHIGTAVLAFWVLLQGGPRGAYLFAVGFGLFYAGLAASGYISGHPLGLGLQPFDHPFHLVLGGLGLVACLIDHRRSALPTADRSHRP